MSLGPGQLQQRGDQLPGNLGIGIERLDVEKLAVNGNGFLPVDLENVHDFVELEKSTKTVDDEACISVKEATLHVKSICKLESTGSKFDDSLALEDELYFETKHATLKCCDLLIELGFDLESDLREEVQAASVPKDLKLRVLTRV